ncbi:unnamed protein product [Mytilus edulis]|uniref:Uncharacterized protein n=1 Tax=Mytilus edulis TaxID=6550 RepID=A0A8S3RU30_MYTED|nr:unnamed protein product [Mytilus edulis]
MEETNRISEVEEESDTVGISITGSTGTREKMARTGNKTNDSQVKILSYSWRTHPERLSAYKDEYRCVFPVLEKSLPVLPVPSLDDMLEPMIKRVHTNKTTKSWDKQKQLFSQPVKQIEKLAYSGQVARIGKSLEPKSGRARPLHHMIRRKCAATDAGVNNLNDIQEAGVLYLPLSDDGVFGLKVLKNNLRKGKAKGTIGRFASNFTKTTKESWTTSSRDSWSK